MSDISCLPFELQSIILNAVDEPTFLSCRLVNHLWLNLLQTRFQARKPAKKVNCVRIIGESGTLDGQFHDPTGITVNNKGHLYVAYVFFSFLFFSIII